MQEPEGAGASVRGGAVREQGEAVVEQDEAVVERRLHPVTPLRRAWAPIAVLVGWALHDPDQTQRQLSRMTTTTLLIVLAVIVPVAALYGFLTWWFTHYAVTGTELRIRTGLLFRRTAHIRLERIQAVDVNRPLLARVAGVAKLRLDVVGAEEKDELAFLGEREARALRAELLARAAGFAPETAHEVGEAPAHDMLRVPPRVCSPSPSYSPAPPGARFSPLSSYRPCCGGPPATCGRCSPPRFRWWAVRARPVWAGSSASTTGR
ncbi:hypothetical protein GCM10020256_32920 [Streptomyces thermocoprophilus]